MNNKNVRGKSRGQENPSFKKQLISLYEKGQAN